MSADATRGPNFAVLVGIAWLVIAANLIITNWAATGLTLSDTDDALRLVQMRSFLDGQGWFDLHEPRLGPTPGYESHWSRPIDAGLPGLLPLFPHFLGSSVAQRPVPAAWPGG